jgi:hypothetical protein
MRNLLAGLAALIILVGALGWFRSWYTVGTLPADPGRFAFRVEVDATKVGSDMVDALRWVQSKFSSDKQDSEEDKSGKDRTDVKAEKEK